MRRIAVHPYQKQKLFTFFKGASVIYLGHFSGSPDNSGRTVESFEAQAKRTFKSLRVALKEINGDLRNLARITVILRYISDFPKLGDIWNEVFANSQYPVSITIVSDFLDPHCLIQVDGVALL